MSFFHYINCSYSIYKIHFFSATSITVCWGLCNLCTRVNVSTGQSSYYRYTDPNININLTADRAVNGEFQNHRRGDCAGTNTETQYMQAWWNISLPDLADIYKINLMFREGCKKTIHRFKFDVSNVET